MERDELLLFPQPLHTLEAYVHAHQRAGDLELADADKAPALNEQDAVLDRLARAPKAVRK